MVLGDFEGGDVKVFVGCFFRVRENTSDGGTDGSPSSRGEFDIARIIDSRFVGVNDEAKKSGSKTAVDLLGARVGWISISITYKSKNGPFAIAVHVKPVDSLDLR